MDYLLKNINSDFVPTKVFDQKKFKKDKKYDEFIKRCNGGYFFQSALHIFGQNELDVHNDLEYRNGFYNLNYQEIVRNLFFFAEDIFGNAFAFDENNKIQLFNLESGETEFIACDFSEWIQMLEKDLDYLTGYSLIEKLSSKQIFKLTYGQRLTPKYPFVLGGKYNLENLVLKDFEENIEFSSSIAKQIYNLPDGSDFEIKFNGETD